jgi:hypothetical protein
MQSWRTVLDLSKMEKLFPNVFFLDAFNLAENAESPHHIRSVHCFTGTDPTTRIILQKDRFNLSQCWYNQERIFDNTNLKDPFPGKPKTFHISLDNGQCFVLHELNNKLQIPPVLRMPVAFGLQDYRSQIDYTLSKIQFSDMIHRLAKIPPGALQFPNRVVVCHLRNEADALRHWSRQNRMSETKFDQRLHDLYITIIQTFVPVHSSIIFLTSRTSENPVLETLQRHHSHEYHIYVHPKSDSTREIDAVVDMAMAINQNPCIFLGPSAGSTFGYWLLQKMPEACECISFDMDNISLPPWKPIRKFVS